MNNVTLRDSCSEQYRLHDDNANSKSIKNLMMSGFVYANTIYLY
jgi:hypothetical protein